MSQALLQRFRDTLSEHGYQITKAREATFSLLISAEPQTMQQLQERAGGRVDRVSIYRNIELFEKIGIVHRIYIGWKYKLELSDDFVQHHHHLACLQCGQIIDIKDEQHIDEFIQEISSRHGFSPRRHQFEIEGYCAGCQTSG